MLAVLQFNISSEHYSKQYLKRGVASSVKIKGLRDIPKNIPIKRDFQVRGELNM